MYRNVVNCCNLECIHTKMSGIIKVDIKVKNTSINELNNIMLIIVNH